MAWYLNNTRFDAIVTMRVVDPGGQNDGLKIGAESAMKDFAPKAGIHDVLVGPGEVIEISGGIVAEFLTVRGAP